MYFVFRTRLIKRRLTAASANPPPFKLFYAARQLSI
jgi:hypothetical protein